MGLVRFLPALQLMDFNSVSDHKPVKTRARPIFIHLDLTLGVEFCIKESSLLLRRTSTRSSFVFGGQLEWNSARTFTEVDCGNAIIYSH